MPRKPASSSKPVDPLDTTLFRLIEAGALARQALLRPLLEAGLQPGDDALLLALGRDHPVSDADLCEVTMMGSGPLLTRLERLMRLGLIVRTDPRLAGAAASRLTERGATIAAGIVADWQRIEDRMLAGEKPRKARKLKALLDRIADRMSA